VALSGSPAILENKGNLAPIIGPREPLRARGDVLSPGAVRERLRRKGRGASGPAAQHVREDRRSVYT
jgi:hypothetical protein